MTGRVVLDGCRPEPLGSYFKALGVFRLVAEQLDPAVTAHWAGDRLVLGTDRSREEIGDFFVDTYRPTPVVSPWNGGSGFHPKDNDTGISAVEGSTSPRLAPYRDAIATARRLVADEGWSERDKEVQVRWCRNELPDDALSWLDAAVVLSSDRLVFPPVLGTGGNVGRLDFSNNFMQRLAEVLALREGRRAPTRDDSADWLHAAVTGAAAAKLLNRPVGQFDPGAAGGTNAPRGGPETSLINPWDYVLTFEGTLLFASGAARRMGAATGGKAAMPFTFDSAPVGYPSAVDGETTKGELWAPLWQRPTSLPEIRRLLGEGRVEWRGDHARRGIDAVRAAASLGVDRGLAELVRFTFVERMGQAMLAVPVGRVATADSLRQDVPVLGELDRWVDQVRRVGGDLPAAPVGALRRLDQTMFDLATARDQDRDASARRLQDVLAVTAELERMVARSKTLRMEVPEPLGNPRRRRGATGPRWPLEANRWLHLLDDGTPELRLAAALASGRDRSPATAVRSADGHTEAAGAGEPGKAGEDDTGASGGAGDAEETTDDGGRRSTAAALLRGIEDATGQRWAWRPDGTPVVPGLGLERLDDVLGRLVQRRVVEVGPSRDVPAPADHQPGGPDEGSAHEGGGPLRSAQPPAPVVHGAAGVDPGFTDGIEAPLDEVVRFVSGAVDDARLERLLTALLLLRFRGPLTLSGPTRDPEAVAVPPAAALVLPFFHGRAFRPAHTPHRVRLWAGRTWPRLLAAGRVGEVVEDARHRLRVARLEPLVASTAAVAHDVDGPRLLAATAFRLSTRSVRSLLARVAAYDSDMPAPSSQGDT